MPALHAEPLSLHATPIAMSTPILLLAGSLLALLPWGQTNQETGLRPRQPAPDPEQLAREMAERIEGCWQLVRVVYQDAPLSGGDFAGYMIVMPGYLSIEMHTIMKSARLTGTSQAFFQSGVHRWRFAGESQLETSSLIGTTNVNGSERWDFEPVGTRRMFAMRLGEATLTLERKGESRLEFRKLPRLPFPGREQELERKQREAAAAAKARRAEQAGGD